MNRFFGMMPCNEIEIEKTFKDSNGLLVRIEAGRNGWTILYADHSSKYEDIEDTAQNNFDKAFSIITKEFGELIEVNASECNAEVIMGEA